jgi:hypothetical protein
MDQSTIPELMDKIMFLSTVKLRTMPQSTATWPKCILFLIPILYAGSSYPFQFSKAIQELLPQPAHFYKSKNYPALQSHPPNSPHIEGKY